MRILYIAGFFAPILAEIKNGAQTYLDEHSVIWIPQRRDKNFQLDLNFLKSDLLDQVRRGASVVHVCCFIFRDPRHSPTNPNEYVWTSITGIKEWAIARHPGLQIIIERFENARDAKRILARISEFKPSRELGFPESLTPIESWARQHHPGRLLLHPRAVRGAKNSAYVDVGLVYRALTILASEYWDLRSATPENREACQVALQASLGAYGLDLSPSITESRSGEQGEDYKVFYPIGGTLKRDLELHIKKGVDREPRNCLRIYFFWDDEIRVAVVGWLTSHLGTRAS